MRSFVKLMLLVVLVPLLMVSAGDDGNRRAVKAPGIDLHGKTYMGFINLDNEYLAPSEFAGSEDAILPTYFVFGQHGTTLYGALVIPSEDPTVPKGDPTNIILEQYAVIEGTINGNTISFKFSGDLEFDFKDLQGDIKDGGNKIVLYVSLKFIGKIKIGEINLCNQSDFLSGLYLGRWKVIGGKDSKVNNVVIGIHVKGNTMQFTTYFYEASEPEEPYVFSSTATFNKEKNTFDFDGNAALEEPDVTGKIDNNEMTIDVTMGSMKGTGKLYFFDDETHKKPKFKKPKPNTSNAGLIFKTKIKHKRGLFGMFVDVITDKSTPGAASVDNVKITRYEFYDKYVEVWFDLSAHAKGSYYAVMTRADGKTVKAKKPFTVVK